MNRLFLFPALLIFSLSACFTTKAQELTGNVRFKSSNESARYGTVDIYKDNKLVSSVLTDSEGNFKVKLDTGMYQCVFQYADCERIVKDYHLTETVHDDLVLQDEKRVSKLKDAMAAPATSHKKAGAGKSGKALRYHASVSRTEDTHEEMEVYMDIPSGGSPGTAFVGGRTISASAGKLTGGEVNDFSKIKMWQDLTQTEMSGYRSAWNMEPQGRYVLQLTTPKGIPLADAQVKLVGSHGKTVYQAHTDNSGKAELWSQLGLENIDQKITYSLLVEYANKRRRIDRAKSFDQGLNRMELDVDCEASNQVDIAFVVDATGSMGDEIQFLKEELNQIVFQSKQINRTLDYRYGTVFYRDKGDDFLVHHLPFTRVVSESADFINSHEAAGGGDYEEAVEDALESAINQLEWSPSARARLLFLIMDAPPHATPQVKEKMERLTRIAAMKGIHIIPIAASGTNKSTEYLMRCMALASNGTYLFLTNHSGIGNHHMEPSTDSYKVETVSEMLKRVITAYTYMPDCKQQIPDLELPYSDSLVQVPDSIPVRDSLQLPVDPQQLSWKFYPNPTSGMIHVEANFDIRELHLTDLSGKILQVIQNIKQGERTPIDLSQYASGIYLLRYPYKDRLITGKIVLQH